MRIGYARVSTAGQDLHAQIEALRADGCGEVVEEVGSGAKARPALDGLLKRLAPGDVLCVWALDRLGRSLSSLVLLLDDLQRRGVQFASLRERIDTGTAAGRLHVHMLAALAEFERARLVERTQAGLAAAKARGRAGGRPSSMSEARIEHARALLAEGKTPAEVAHMLGISRSTLYRHGCCGAASAA